MQLVIASSNLHKMREFRELLRPVPNLDLLSLKNFPTYQALPEEGQTFEENARVKALHAAQALQTWVLADDSGLVVPALQGEPGVFSARYAGEGASDLDNRKKLLQKMRALQDEERSAYFECCLVVASPEKIEKVVTARCEGSIAPTERGSHGFGYDSLFLKSDYDKTFGEMEEALKNRISHRAKAVEKLLIFLESL